MFCLKTDDASVLFGSNRDAVLYRKQSGTLQANASLIVTGVFAELCSVSMQRFALFTFCSWCVGALTASGLNVTQLLTFLLQKVNALYGLDPQSRFSASLFSSNLNLYGNQQYITKINGGNSGWDTVLSDAQWSTGIHGMAFEILITTSSQIMFACLLALRVEFVFAYVPLSVVVQYWRARAAHIRVLYQQLPGLDNDADQLGPQYALFSSLFCLLMFASRSRCVDFAVVLRAVGTDNIYQGSSITAYGLPTWTAGTIVGVELNMNAKTARWSVNGVFGPSKTLTGTSYSIAVAFYQTPDNVRVLPELCYHA